MTRIEFEGDLHRVVGSRLYVGGAGRLFEIIGKELALLYDPEAQVRESDKRLRRIKNYLEKNGPTTERDLFNLRIARV